MGRIPAQCAGPGNNVYLVSALVYNTMVSLHVQDKAMSMGAFNCPFEIWTFFYNLLEGMITGHRFNFWCESGINFNTIVLKQCWTRSENHTR